MSWESDFERWQEECTGQREPRDLEFEMWEESEKDEGKLYEIAALYKMIREAQKKAYEMMSYGKGLKYREQFNEILDGLDTARSMASWIKHQENVR